MAMKIKKLVFDRQGRLIFIGGVCKVRDFRR